MSTFLILHSEADQHCLVVLGYFWGSASLKETEPPLPTLCPRSIDMVSNHEEVFIKLNLMS